MPGEGFIASANSSLKNNRRLRDKPKFKDNRRIVNNKSTIDELVFPSPGKKQIEKIKKIILKKADKERKTEIILFFISLMIVIVFLLFIF